MTEFKTPTFSLSSTVKGARATLLPPPSPCLLGFTIKYKKMRQGEGERSWPQGWAEMGEGGDSLIKTALNNVKPISGKPKY